MGYGSQDGYDWMMDTYSPSNTWWMPEGLNFDGSLSGGGFDFQEFETDLGNMGITETENLGYGGFSLGFDEVNAVFNVLDKDIFTDAFTIEDKSYLNSIGIDADKLVSDAFGEDGLLDLSQNGEVTPDANPSVTRQKILDIYSDPKNLGEAEVYLRTFVKELDYLQHKRASDNIQNTVSKAYGFSNAEIREINQLADLEDFRNRFNVALQDFVDSDYYDGRFNNPDIIDERETITLDESMGYTPESVGYGDVVSNPDFGKYIVDQDLINDFAYGVDKITEDDVNDSINKIDLSFGQNTGETISSSGYFIAVALDLLGMSGVGTSLYVTQAGYNYVVNGVERIANKLTGLGFDFPNLNIHEMAAEILNQKFVDKDGEPILEGIADKTKYLMPFHNPEATLSLAGMGGTQLGKFDPTGENIFENIADALLEGNILDAVQEQSEEGKFEGVESNRRTGAIGMLDSISSYVQGLGVAGQKIFGPGLTQMIIDNAIFKGYPVSGLANGISAAMGPQSAKDWVRYLENKGIDPNNVQEADISYWRSTLDNYFEDDSVSEPSKTGFDVLLDSANKGGLSAKYLSSLSSYLEEITNKPMDRMQPAEIIAVLNDQVQSSIDRGEKYDPENGLDVLYKQLGGTFEVNDKVGFGENNEFYFDLETINRLKETFPDITDSEYEAGFDYLISEGAEGTQFTEGVDFEITSDASFFATNYVEEEDYIVMRDVPAVASYFDYRTNEQGDEFVYDPMSGVTYEFEQARLFDEPGTRDDLYTFPSLSAEDLRNSDRTLNKEILKELALTGKLEYKELRDLVTSDSSLFGGGNNRNVLHSIDLELGDFYLKKYAGLTDEELKDFNQSDYLLPGTDSPITRYGSRTDQIAIAHSWNTPGGSFGQGGWKTPTLEYMLMLNGYTDENFDVLQTNEAYDENYTEESIFELRPFEVIEEENGVPLVVADTFYGFTEYYDPNRLNPNTGEYLFREYSYDELKYKPWTTGGYSDGSYNITPGQSYSPLYTNSDDRAKVLKSLLEQGKITKQEAEDLDWSYYLATNPPTPPTGYDPLTGQPFGDYTTEDDVLAQWQRDSIFYNSNNEPNWIESEEYAAIEEIDLSTPIDYEAPVTSFYDLPDFVVTGFDDIDTLGEAYQDRLDFIDNTNFDFSTKEFLKDSAFDLFKSRKAFIELDETSQQLILDAQAEATSDFVNLGVFTVTANNITDLDTELQTRLNQITASELSEGQEQYEINLANAIYNSKLSEINTLTSKNLAITTAENARDIAIQNEGASSQNAANLQARINKIESYEIPEFNVTAYIDAEDQSAYMQNFVDEVMKGTTEEFGNFLSASNADQILANVAALAQSETDLGIAETAQKENYDNYQKYLGLYNTANTQLTTARETLEANELTIADLEADLYVELENFEVTASDIEGGQSQLDSFNEEIDRMVSDGEITSEQGELEKSLATNTFNVYKATQDIASLQTTSDAEITRLNDLVVSANNEADRIQGLLDNAETRVSDLEAEEIRLGNDIAELDAQALTDSENYTALQTEKNRIKGLLDTARADRDAQKAAKESAREDVSILQLQLETAQGATEALQAFSLPEFNVTATNQVELDAYLDSYQSYVDEAEANKDISAEQAINFDTIIASIRNNGSQIFTLEAANKDKQDEIDELKGVNTGLSTTIGEKEEQILDLTGTISVIGSGFDVTLYDDIGDLETGLASYIQGINDSDLDEEMKESQIAFAESMADMRRENLFVPTYEAPDFNVIAEGDLTGLNQSYSQAMFTLDSFLGNEYITQEEYDANVSALNESYNTRKETLVPAYTLPEFTVSDLDAEGGFTNLDAEKEEFLNELQSFLDNDYITREEHDALEAQIESAYDTKKRDITPVYEAPDFTVYGQLEPGGTFEDIDAEYNTAFDELTLNARLGYISTSDYITQLNDLQTSYEDARKGIAPAYELPDFSVYGQIAEGDDTTEIDTAYQNELTRLEEYKDSGYISLSEYYGFLGELETEYTTRREGVLPTYTMPDFSVTPASSLAELAEMEQAARDRFGMFSDQEYFPEDFDILTEQGNLESLFDAERARLQGTYTLPEFAVEDTKGLLKQEDISNLFSEYEEGLKGDVLEGMLGLTDFFSAMEGAQTTFDIEYGKRKPIQPREGGYQIIPDANNEGDGPSDSDFFDYVDDGNYADQYGTIGGIDTSGILTGNYMAKLDPAYQLAEMLLGEAGARDLFPTGKSRGLADEQFQDVVNQFMLGQADDAFDMQAGLAGKQQDLTDQLTRLKRQSDLDLMAEFGDPYRKQIEDLYPGATEALQAQQEIARRSADRARGDLSPSEQSALEQSSYLFGAGRGREYDPFTLANQISEESQVRQLRDTQASNQQIAAMNAERGLYGDLMSIIGTDSPYGAGAGQVTTPFNIAGIMDLGTVDYANEQRLQEAQLAVSSLQRDYDTAVALREPSRAQSILNDLNQAKQTVDTISMGLSTAQQAFGTVKDIFGGITNIFGGGRSGINTNSFNINAPTSVDYGDKDSFSRYLFGMGL